MTREAVGTALFRAVVLLAAAVVAYWARGYDAAWP